VKFIGLIGPQGAIHIKKKNTCSDLDAKNTHNHLQENKKKWKQECPTHQSVEDDFGSKSVQHISL
jgi:hypothetical protein